MIKTRDGINLGSSFSASGSRGFFKEGYRHHKVFEKFLYGFDFAGSTFIAKTVTMQERMPTIEELRNLPPEGKGCKSGNLPLDRETLQPIERFPDCIRVYLLAGEALNSVGLTGSGVVDMFARGNWQKINERFGISFMTMGETRQERLREMRSFRNTMKAYLPSFSIQPFLQINKSCPNTGKNPSEFVGDILGELAIANEIGIPVGIKINVLTPIEVIREVQNSNLCDFVEIPNTLPYGAMPDRVNWKKKYGKKSPLSKYGGGGYSGPENFQLALEWMIKAREAGICLPIICGGVSGKNDVYAAYSCGADAVAFARITMSPFHAWKIKGIIQSAKILF